MSEAFLKSIDDRLVTLTTVVGQKLDNVNGSVVELRTSLGEVKTEVTGLRGDVAKLPTWKKLATAMGLITAIFTWLLMGGGKALGAFLIAHF